MDQFVEFMGRFGPWGLALHSFLDAIIFPIPAFFTQVSLSMLNPQNAIWLATLGFIACLIGTPIGYLIGKLFGTGILTRFVKPELTTKATNYFKDKGSIAILIGAFTPIPFKVFTILSGVLKFPLWQLMAYAAIGRATKFYVVGVLFFLFDKAAASMMDNVSLYIMLAVVPIIVIFLLIRRTIRKRKERKQLALAVDTDKEDVNL